MSFRDVSLPRDKAAHAPRPAVLSVPMSAASQEMPAAPAPAVVTPAKKTRPMVLHGRVVNVIDADAMEHLGTQKTYARLRMERSVYRHEGTIRQSFERKSTFAQLTHETQQFQKLVADLEGGILDPAASESPEGAWRARILIRSAGEASKDLGNKLYQYERTLLSPTNGTVAVSKDKENSQKELRVQQSACMKLHRDYNRSHKGLTMALTHYQKRQNAEVSRLSAVGWSQVPEKQNDDFFDRAMREREAELDTMNKSMHKVSEIYNELACIVDGQQDDIDALDDSVRDSKASVDAGYEQISCLMDRQHLCGAMSFGMDDLYDGEEKLEHSLSPPVLEKGQSFDWYMPFETLGEDMSAVHRDIVGLGKDIIMRSHDYQNSRRRQSLP